MPRGLVSQRWLDVGLQVGPSCSSGREVDWPLLGVAVGTRWTRVLPREPSPPAWPRLRRPAYVRLPITHMTWCPPEAAG